jgi:hypothetical protein
MHKITKLCGTKKSYIILPEDEKIESSLIYFCNNCKRETKEKILLCYPETKEQKDLNK